MIQNPIHPVSKLNFKNINLGGDGLIRILEACNANKNIKSVNLGYVNSRGLCDIAKLLNGNKTLAKLKFAECKTGERWNQKSMDEFIVLIKDLHNTNLTKVKFEPATKKDELQGHKLFKKEIEFYVKKIK